MTVIDDVCVAYVWVRGASSALCRGVKFRGALRFGKFAIQAMRAWLVWAVHEEWNVGPVGRRRVLPPGLHPGVDVAADVGFCGAHGSASYLAQCAAVDGPLGAGDLRCPWGQQVGDHRGDVVGTTDLSGG